MMHKGFQCGVRLITFFTGLFAVSIGAASAGNDCSSATTCTFDGLICTALGGSTLSLVGDNLVVHNLGSSGNDGVAVSTPTPTGWHADFMPVSIPDVNDA